MLKERGLYFIAFIITIALGLASRTDVIPDWIYPYLGDALYATMFYFIIAILYPQYPLRTKWIAATLCCWAIETFQLYQAPWINEIRQTVFGKYVLGSGFLWSDMIAYVFGASFGLLADYLIFSTPKSNKI